MNNNGSAEKMDRSLGFFALISMGIGCMFGTSWLLLLPGWLSKAGGPWNAILALFLCFVIELPLALAYLEVIPMFPLSGGEMVYSYMAFGPFGGVMAAWAGVIMNGVIYCWETVSAIKIVSFMFPVLNQAPTIYTVLDYPITVPSLIIGVALAVLIAVIQLNGTSFSSNVSKFLTTSILIVTVAAVIAGFMNMHPEYLSVPATKSAAEGSISLLAALTFSIAGWETVAKAAGEATGEVAKKKAGLALILCLAIVVGIYMICIVSLCGMGDWTTLTNLDVPFCDLLNQYLGNKVFSYVILIIALFGIIGVANSTLYGASRIMYGCAEVGLIPKFFKKLNKHRVPSNCILVLFALAFCTPFIGKGAFYTLIDITAVATIVMWVMTFFSVIVMRKKYPDMKRPYVMPGGKFTIIIGIIFCVFLVGSVLLPISPGSIIWPNEHIWTAVLFLIGVVLYMCRDKSITTEEQKKMILGEAKEATVEETKLE